MLEKMACLPFWAIMVVYSSFPVMTEVLFDF